MNITCNLSQIPISDFMSSESVAHISGMNLSFHATVK